MDDFFSNFVEVGVWTNNCWNAPLISAQRLKWSIPYENVAVNVANTIDHTDKCHVLRQSCIIEHNSILQMVSIEWRWCNIVIVNIKTTQK